MFVDISDSFVEFWMTELCMAYYALGSFGLFTSALVEIHLAASLLAILLLSPRGLNVLSRSLFVVWPGGLFLGIYNTDMSDMNWSGRSCALDEPVVVGGVVELCCVSLCAIMYVIAFLRVFCTTTVGLSVQRRVWARTHYFLLVWLICVFPDLVRIVWFVTQTQRRTSVFRILTLCLLALHGLVNALVHSVLNRSLRRIEMRSMGTRSTSGHDETSGRHSFFVSIGGATEWSIPATTSSSSTL
jgi:hypothetical protein